MIQTKCLLARCPVCGIGEARTVRQGLSEAVDCIGCGRTYYVGEDGSGHTVCSVDKFEDIVMAVDDFITACKLDDVLQWRGKWNGKISAEEAV